MYDYEDWRPQAGIGSFRQHDAALQREAAIAERTLPGAGFSMQEQYDALLRENLQQREALTSTNHQLRMRVEELERVTGERDIAEKNAIAVVEATGGVMPVFERQGQFTICVLVDPISERIFTGAACCNAQDEYNETIGRAISLGRAMNARGEFFAEYAFNR